MGRLREALEREGGVELARPPARLKSVYFDTKRLDLRRAGLVLRVRHEGERYVQTVKRIDGPNAGLFDRAEWEKDIASARPDVAALKKLRLGRVVKKARKSLIPVFKTVVTRATYRLGNPHGINVAFDEGYVAARRRRAPIGEIELELESGDPSGLFRVARNLQRTAPLRVGVASKSDRGYDLLEGRQTGPVRAGKFRLSRGITARQAFQAIAQDGLRQLVVNEPVLQRGDFEALHQMRVASRRLRAALSLFATIVEDAKVEAIKSQLKWITEQFAPARELDVFFTGLPSLADEQKTNGKEIESAADSFRAELARRRESALERAKAAASSARFRELLLDLTQWIAVGPWTSPQEPRQRAAIDGPIETYATGELRRRRRKISKRGRKLRQLDAHARHKLRINVKKLRYATDFFADLFPGKTAKRRGEELAAAMKELQNSLGRLNDIAAHTHIAIDVARDGENCPHHRSESHWASGRRRAFGAGLVTGEEVAEVTGILEEAARAHKRFASVKPFWK